MALTLPTCRKFSHQHLSSILCLVKRMIGSPGVSKLLIRWFVQRTRTNMYCHESFTGYSETSGDRRISMISLDHH
jgi:hypothetical protein